MLYVLGDFVWKRRSFFQAKDQMFVDINVIHITRDLIVL